MTAQGRTKIAVVAAGMALALAVFIVILVDGRKQSDAATRPERSIGLATSLPIFWDEALDFNTALEPSTPHWVRNALDRRFAIRPLDTLSASDGEPSPDLRDLSLLLLAQPRAISPADFTALDAWVRNGGRALIFADPFLTEHSRYSIGDPRRPQGAALMSPIFGYWGLTQTYDDARADRTTVEWEGLSLPID
ncbi:MAG: hypothetical protein WA908_05200, partial [Pontixanthobacter sp.]